MYTVGSTELAVQGLEVLSDDVSEAYLQLRAKLNHEALGAAALQEYDAHQKEMAVHAAGLEMVVHTLPRAMAEVKGGHGVESLISSFSVSNQADARFLQNHLLWYVGTEDRSGERDAVPYWIIGTKKAEMAVSLLITPVNLDASGEFGQEGLVKAHSRKHLAATVDLNPEAYKNWRDARKTAINRGFTRPELANIYSDAGLIIDHETPGSSVIDCYRHKRPLHRYGTTKQRIAVASLNTPSNSGNEAVYTPIVEDMDTPFFVSYDTKSHLDFLAVAFQKVTEFKDIYEHWGTQSPPKPAPMFT